MGGSFNHLNIIEPYQEEAIKSILEAPNDAANDAEDELIIQGIWKKAERFE